MRVLAVLLGARACSSQDADDLLAMDMALDAAARRYELVVVPAAGAVTECPRAASRGGWCEIRFQKRKRFCFCELYLRLCGLSSRK